MELIRCKNKYVTITLSEDELYVIRSIVGEIYESVCVDAKDYEAIHGVEKNEVLKLEKDLNEIYDLLIRS